MTVVAQLVNGRAGVRPALLARTSITLFLISVPLGVHAQHSPWGQHRASVPLESGCPGSGFWPP